MAIDHFQKFLQEIGYPLGISSLKTTDYTKFISLLDIHTYDEKKSVFFYDVLTELAQYYLIQQTVAEEFSDDNLFKNVEKIIEEKSILFESLNNEYFEYFNKFFSINEMKKNIFVQALNPYYNNPNFRTLKKDKLPSRIRFSDSDFLRLHYAWAIIKICKFAKCYVIILLIKFINRNL